MNSTGRAPWRGYFAISLFWVAMLGGALLFARQPAAAPIEIIPPPTPAATAPPTATPAPTATPSPAPLRVDVIGAVREPGVRALPPGSIVDDAIRAAGGPSADADLERVNKATALQDGAQVYVPRRDDPAERPVILTSVSPPATAAAPIAGSEPSVPQRSASAAVGGLVDINNATLEELERLPEVGPKTAQLIVDGRPYATVDDLLRVKGIGPATLAEIKPFATVQ